MTIWTSVLVANFALRGVALSTQMAANGSGETMPVCHSETSIGKGRFYVAQAVDFGLCRKSLQNSSHAFFS
jgi:hypothetical protein